MAAKRRPIDDRDEVGTRPSRSAGPLLAPIGQGEALRRWLALARRLALPHGLIVEGASGVGKSTVVRWLTAALLCPSELDADAPCGVCRTCARIADGVHPDVQILDRARDEQDHKLFKKSYYVITVEQVRAGKERLTRLALEGRARVLAIADADCLDEEAQNALLKTLEEPGRATFLLLEAKHPEQLLPTVRSRCQRLRVLPLDGPTLSRELSLRSSLPTASCERAVAIARGSLGQALAVCTERAVQVHDLVRAVLHRPQGLRPVAVARAALLGAPERRLEVDAARLFLWLLRSEVRSLRDGLAGEAPAVYGGEDAEPWTSWLELTLAAERDLDALIPPEQVLTACLLGFDATV